MGNTPASNPFAEFINWLLALLGLGPKPLSMPRRVLAIVFRPGGPKYAAHSAGWHDPETLMTQYIARLNQVSGGQLTYEVTVRKAAAYFPVLADGRCYDDDSWAAARDDDTQAFRGADGAYEPVDTPRLLADFQLVQAVAAGTLDEVWLFGGPLFGFAESCMVGQDAFPCNGPKFVADCPRFVIMGFNYERAVDEMVHDYGHRVESCLAYHYGSTTLLNAMYPDPAKYDQVPLPPNAELPAPQNDFDRFLLDHGTVHRKPGGIAYSQDVAAWLALLPADWWPCTIDPARA